MNALAGLIRAPTSASGDASAGASDEDTFKLNLFGDPAGGSASGAAAQAAAAAAARAFWSSAAMRGLGTKPPA